MALPTSGPISLSMIRTEFGVSGTVSMSQLYRGGGIVPNTPANAAVPTSGTIKFSNLYGATKVSLSVTATDINNSVFRGSGDPADIYMSGTTSTTVTGNVGPVTYSWEKVSGSPSMNISSSTAANPTFSTNVGVNTIEGATWRVTVANSGVTATDTISVSLEYWDNS